MKEKYALNITGGMRMLEKCMLLGMLALMAREDIRTEELPVVYLLISGAAGIGIYLWKQPFSVGDLLGGIAVGLFLLLCAVISREGIGKGDGYLFCVTGSFLGLQENLVLLIIALSMCAVFAVGLLAVKRCGRLFRVPFVPFVLAADMLLLCR